jgi:hypothetical protein
MCFIRRNGNKLGKQTKIKNEERAKKKRIATKGKKKT